MTFRNLLFVLLLFSAGALSAQDDAAYGKTLKKMFKASGSADSYEAIIGQMMDMFKQQYSDLGDDFWNDFEKEFSTDAIKDLTEMLVPVYQKHLSIEDLNQIIEFYKSPVGKKFADKTPMIAEESMQIGQAWGMKIGEDFGQKMMEKGK